MPSTDSVISYGAPGAREDLIDAAIGLDGERMRDIVHAVKERHGYDALVADVLVPTLRTIGDMWSSGRLSVMHEHHASSIIRSVIGEVRRRDTSPDAPCVVLGCPPGELHDLPSHMFALMLMDRGLRTVVLGASTPVTALAQAVRATAATGCVVIARRERPIVAYQSALSRLGRNTAVFVAGPAATAANGSIVGLRPLPFDWRQAADIVRSAATCDLGQVAG